jgi:fatty acid desaturase
MERRPADKICPPEVDLMEGTAPSAPLPVPGALNICIALGAYAAAIWLLWFASHTSSTWQLVAAAIAFSYVNNTIFSLLHESVHGYFHSRRALNDFFGMISAAFFPTGLLFQRVCHFGHHRRNRSDDEMFECYTPNKSRFQTWFHLYCLLTGWFWFSAPLGCAIYLLTGPFFARPMFKEKIARFYGMEATVKDLARAPVWRMRGELLFSTVFQAGLILLFDLSVAGWLACYLAFAVNWCSLQYTDHAYSPRDVREGASNLKVNRVLQWIFLNYHHHLAHHRNPAVPWIHLPKFVDFSKPRPSFLRIYGRLWLGPRHTNEPPPARPDPGLESQLLSRGH